MNKQRLELALQALQASRAALRGQMLPAPQASGSAAQSGLPGLAGTSLPWLQWLRQLKRQVRRWPVATLATQAVQRWWRQQPWRDTGELLAGGLVAQAQPLVRKYPVASVAVAAGLGAALVAARPWRWPVVSQQLRPLPHRVTTWGLEQLTSAPVQAALAAWMLNTLTQAAPPADAGDTAQPGGSGLAATTPTPASTPGPAPAPAAIQSDLS